MRIKITFGLWVVCIASLLVFDPTGRARYSGGYFGRQIVDPHDPFQDLAVLDRLRNGEAVTPFGPFGWKSAVQAR